MFQIGQKILAKWSDSGKRDLDSLTTPSYSATIRSINDDETYDILFNDRTLQQNTLEKYITTEEKIKLENRLEFLKQFEVKTRAEIKRGSKAIYWIELPTGKFKKLGQYVTTTVPWEGVEKGTEYERTFLHFTDLDRPIESSHHTDIFYAQLT
jgi:hypothetical protein